MEPFPSGVPQYAQQVPPKEPVRRGRRKINIEYIQDKSRRQITFSKRKAGIMKKAYELATLTGTQVLLLVASESGHVYTFATPKLQPLITEQEGKNLIQNCLNAPSANPEPEATHEQESPNAGLNIHPYAHKRELDEGDDDDEDPMPRGKAEQKMPEFTPQPSYPPLGASFHGPSYLNQHLYGRQMPVSSSLSSPIGLPNLPGPPPSYVTSSHHPLGGPSFPPYGYSSQQPQYQGGNYLMRPLLSSPALDMGHHGGSIAPEHLRRPEDDDVEDDDGEEDVDDDDD